MLLLLSGIISLNPGPLNSSQQYNNDQSGLHFVLINFNRLLPNIAKLSEAAVINISESKSDDAVLSSEIPIENYDLISPYRKRHGGGVACFRRNYLSYYTKSFLPPEMENVFVKVFFTTLGLLWVVS